MCYLKNCDLEISKYKLWKTIHELGFRYKKLSGNRKCLVERTDIVDQRINYLRTIKKKRGFIPVYLNETWVDTHHTASHQLTSDSIFKNRKIPLSNEYFFSQSCDIKSEFSYIICSYLRRLVIQNSSKCTEILQIFSIRFQIRSVFFFINCDLFIELLLTDLCLR